MNEEKIRYTLGPGRVLGRRMVIISIEPFTKACSEHTTLPACVKKQSGQWRKDPHDNINLANLKCVQSLESCLLSSTMECSPRLLVGKAKTLPF